MIIKAPKPLDCASISIPGVILEQNVFLLSLEHYLAVGEKHCTLDYVHPTLLDFS